jgi:hypothetical protein
MKTSLVLAAAVFAAGLARADIVLVQNIDGMGQNAQMTVTVGASKVRTDVTPQISMITDTATGDVTTIMNAQKTYMVTTAAMSKAMMSAAIQQSGTMSTNPAPPVATGKKDKINGYDASEYTFSNGNLKATYWICSDFPNGKAVTDALAKLQNGGLASITKGFTPDLSTLPGVPVKTEVEINGQKITTELVSATEQNIDPSTYAVPAGYNEVKMPAIPQQ